MSTLLPLTKENDTGIPLEAEPGLEWKNEMRKVIEVSMQEMVELARQDRDAQLRKAMTDAAREGVEQVYQITMSELIALAQEAYLFELARERKERRAVSGGPINADVMREQQAITAAVKRGESELSQTQHNTSVGEGVSHRLNGDSQPPVPDRGNQRGGPMYSDRSLHSNVDRCNPEHLAPRVPNPGSGRKTSTRVEQEWMSIEKAREIRAEVQGSSRQQSSASSFNVRAGDYLPTSGSVPYSQPMPIPRSPDNHDVNGSSFSSGYRPKRQEKKSSLTVVPPTSIPTFQDFLYEPGLKGTGTHRPNGEERRGIPIGGSSRMPVSPQGSPESSRYMKSTRNKSSFTYDSRQPQGSPSPGSVHGPGDVPTMHSVSASRPIPKSSTVVDDRACRSPSSYDMRNSYSSHSPPVQSVAGANRPLAKQPSFTPNNEARAHTGSSPLHRYYTQDIRGDQHETGGAGSMRSPSSNPNFSYHYDQPSPMLGESDEFNEDDRKKEMEMKQKEEELQRRENELEQRELEEVMKKAAAKVKQTKKEVMKKAAEAERMAEEVRIREEETRKKVMEVKQKEEELQRREKELEQRELKERKRWEREARQEEEERKREEEERRRKERKAKKKENERKLDEELKRRAEAATSRLQEEFSEDGGLPQGAR